MGRLFMRAKKIIVIIIVSVISIPILLIFTSAAIYSPEYMVRILSWGESDVNDFQRFPNRAVKNSEPIFNFDVGHDEDLVSSVFRKVEYKYNSEIFTVKDLDNFLEANMTTAFIVIRDNNILYEKYFNGYTRDSVNTTFSAAKSFTSALIGIAIDEGYIEDEKEPITNYIPELEDNRFEQITIEHLLLMASGIGYVEGPLWFGDDAKTYYYPDLRELAIYDTEIVDEPGKYFLYNNYHPLLLGIILERATGYSVSKYFEEKIWKPLGMEYPGSWSIDGREDGLEKMESGINARTIDFAKFGRLFLNRGEWNGTQVISEDWVVKSTSKTDFDNEDYYNNMFSSLQGEKTFYKYMWYGFLRDGKENDFFAEGKYNQVIYISPSKDLIIVRNGISSGEVDSWPDIFYNVASEI